MKLVRLFSFMYFLLLYCSFFSNTSAQSYSWIETSFLKLIVPLRKLSPQFSTTYWSRCHIIPKTFNSELLFHKNCHSFHNVTNLANKALQPRGSLYIRRKFFKSCSQHNILFMHTEIEKIFSELRNGQVLTSVCPPHSLHLYLFCQTLQNFSDPVETAWSSYIYSSSKCTWVTFWNCTYTSTEGILFWNYNRGQHHGT